MFQFSYITLAEAMNIRKHVREKRDNSTSPASALYCVMESMSNSITTNTFQAVYISEIMRQL